MNFGNHVTHYGGKPLKMMNREELIEALQMEKAAHDQTIQALKRALQKGGRVDYFVSDG